MRLCGDRKPVSPIHPLTNWQQFSPDGHWVAYQSNESGRFEIYVQPFPGLVESRGFRQPGEPRHGGGMTGKELFFMSPDLKLMAARVQASGSTFESASPVTLFQTRAARGGSANVRQQYDVSQDGRFLINTVTETSTVPITLILNWRPKR